MPTRRDLLLAPNRKLCALAGKFALFAVKSSKPKARKEPIKQASREPA